MKYSLQLSMKWLLVFCIISVTEFVLHTISGFTVGRLALMIVLVTSKIKTQLLVYVHVCVCVQSLCV